MSPYLLTSWSIVLHLFHLSSLHVRIRTVSHISNQVFQLQGSTRCSLIAVFLVLNHHGWKQAKLDQCQNPWILHNFASFKAVINPTSQQLFVFSGIRTSNWSCTLGGWHRGTGEPSRNRPLGSPYQTSWLNMDQIQKQCEETSLMMSDVVNNLVIPTVCFRPNLHKKLYKS